MKLVINYVPKYIFERGYSFNETLNIKNTLSIHNSNMNMNMKFNAMHLIPNMFLKCRYNVRFRQ